MICKQCGTQNKDTVKFCKQCGGKVLQILRRKAAGPLRRNFRQHGGAG
ncbi:MAG: zinc-ribbon domain-containing protein [Acidaminococcales bacterium]|nr:zinc-ribbon domain-containing protein [Acidaminococcales bacterium]